MIEFAGNTTPPATVTCQEGNFHIGFDQLGKPNYQWLDTGIEELSSMKLWNILRQAKPGKSELQHQFVTAVNRELHQRGELPPPDVKLLFRR